MALVEDLPKGLPLALGLVFEKKKIIIKKIENPKVVHVN